MKSLNIKAFGGLLWLFLVLAVCLSLGAGTIYYWQAWVFLLMFFLPATAITLYLMKKDPQLLERRIHAGPTDEKELSQKIIQFFALIAFLAVIIFPAVDHRFGWSVVPWYITLVGDILIAVGFFIVFLVFKENTFTSALIEIVTEQKVISTGPYASIRHPMYSGALVMLLGVPLSLGSWWGLLFFIPMLLVMVWRLFDEELFLVKHLPGYAEYRDKVRYRLIPFIW
jgi:protein-S-isoprenylcysteine O-methyltransferase Ste14